ncbi:MAG: hypothetical protein ABW210_12655, partial [Achromobacter sp.]
CSTGMARDMTPGRDRLSVDTVRYAMGPAPPRPMAHSVLAKTSHQPLFGALKRRKKHFLVE